MVIIFIGFSSLLYDIFSFKSFNLFPRSGAVIVSICIVLAAIDIGKVLKRIRLSDEEQVIVSIYREWVGKDPEGSIDGRKKRYKRSHIIFYSFYSILGTLINGYGDLFVGIFKNTP